MTTTVKRPLFSIKAPATSANLGPGFDTLGLALPLYLRVVLSESASGGLEVEAWGEGADILTADPGSNLFVEALVKTLSLTGKDTPGLHILMDNEIPLSRGLGSSAAAIAAGVLAGNELAGSPLAFQEVLNLASSLEGHPDNVVPALVGGFTVSLVEKDNIYFRRLEPPPAIKLVTAIPGFGLSTRQARAVRPALYPSQDVVFNLQRACFLVASLATNQLTDLNFAMSDVVHQPYRQELVPGFQDVIQSALEAGAMGAALSGAGPSVIALTAQNAEQVGQAMRAGFSRHGVDARIMILAPCCEGAQIERE